MIVVSLNSRLESDTEEEKNQGVQASQFGSMEVPEPVCALYVCVCVCVCVCAERVCVC